MSLLTVTLDASDTTKRLDALSNRLSNLRPVLKVIGEELTESTKRRFETSTAPDGQRWEENAESTLLGHKRIGHP